MRDASQWLCEPYSSLLRKLLDKALEVLGGNLVSLVVYGSVARCEAEKASDVDLLLVVESAPKSRLRRQEVFMSIEDLLEEDLEALRSRGYEVDFSPVIKTVEEAKRFSPLYIDMVEDAVILYDRNGFFRGVLEALAARLRELGAERVRVGKKWYWRLKKDYKFGEVIEF
jgi:predicted nucleotidyltransferase